MKLVTFAVAGRKKLGVATAAGIIDLSVLNPELDVSMNEFLRHSKRLAPIADRILDGETTLPAHALLPEVATHLLSPVPHPPSVRDGYAFRQHVETARKNRGLPMIPEFDSFPVFYFTNNQAIIGPGELRVGGRRLEQLDYELEIAAVIGREVRNPTLAEADDAIFGFTIMNDFSARALQMEEMKLNLGPAKGKDFATALGPWLVTKDELSRRIDGTEHGNVLHAKMTASINGEKLSEGNAEQMNWTFAQIIARAADGVTLHPGDVIGSGTVGTGCLLELNGSKVTNNRWLRPGDEISLSVEGLGTLTNRIVEDPAC